MRRSTLTLQKVDQRDPTPKYLQAREILVEAIRSGRLAPGAKLPSTKEISSLFDVSLITAHKALEGLVEAGYLRREVGRGTYVRDDVGLDGASRRLSIGLLLDQRTHVNIDDYYHSTIVNGLRRAARADNGRVEFFFQDGFESLGERKRDVGAICIHPPLDAQARVERLAHRAPVLVLGGTLPGARVACVDCDNERGARAAVRHLRELGHQRFMVLSGPMNLSNARDRANGALAALASEGIRLEARDQPVSSDSVVLDDDTRGRVERRLREPSRPTALVAGGYYLALAAMQSVRRVGLRIPEDVSLVAFDDPASAPLLDPPLTTVRQPLEEMSALAYRWMRQAILGEPLAPLFGKLPAELVVRGSTAAPQRA